MKTHFALLMAMALHVAPVFADCAPEALAKKIDLYGQNPFSALDWRVLNGLGDPGIEASYGAYEWEAKEQWSKLAATVNAAAGDQRVGYDCRMEYPLAILQSRIKRYGETSDFVQSWLRNQQRVIAACSEEAVPAADPVPESLSSKDQKLFDQDRAYQDASSEFYKNPPEAIRLFRQIGASSSPHRASARYNVVSLLANAKNVIEAKAEAQAILADPEMRHVHRITEDLLGYIANIEDTPEGWTAVINRSIRFLNLHSDSIKKSEDLSKTYAFALNDIDYAGIKSKSDDWWIAGKLPENPTISKAIYDAARREPMALWMMTGQSIQNLYRNNTWTYDGEKWNAYVSSYIDRAMALQPASQGISGLARDLIDALKAGTDDQSRSKLWAQAQSAMQAAKDTCGETPETAAAPLFLQHAVRLSALAGKFDEIYDGLQNVPFRGARSYYNDVVLRLGKFLLAQGNLEEGRRYRDRLLTPAFFQPVDQYIRQIVESDFSDLEAAFAEDERHWKQAMSKSLLPISSPEFNLLPISKLIELSQDTTFSTDQRALLRRAAWTRQYALNQKPDPTLTAAVFGDLPGTPGVPKSDNELLLQVLRNPRFGILINSDTFGDPVEAKRENFAEIDQYDHNDKNWWCPLEPDRHLGRMYQGYDGLIGLSESTSGDLQPMIDPQISKQMRAARDRTLSQHPMVKIIDWVEVDRLANALSAPALLSNKATGWARLSNGTDGADEALALAVRVTRYGCNWHGGVGYYSRPAQELLKTRFPNSPWVAKTPYWFNCLDWTYDDQYNAQNSCKPRTWPTQQRP